MTVLSSSVYLTLYTEQPSGESMKRMWLFKKQKSIRPMRINAAWSITLKKINTTKVAANLQKIDMARLVKFE